MGDTTGTDVQKEHLDTFPPIITHTAETAASDLNRRLCAGAYAQKGFRDHVIETVLEARHRAFGPSTGIDMANLVSHCLNARALHRKRDIILVLLAFFVHFFFSFTAAITQSPGFGMLGWCVLIVASVWISFRYFWINDVRIIARQFSKASFNPDFPGKTLSQYQQQRVDEAIESQSGNAIVYGGFSPFVGSGLDHGGWSFAINLKPASAQGGSSAATTPEEFNAEDLYKTIEAAISSLRLEGLTVEDKVYVHGSDLCLLKDFQPKNLERPTLNFDKEQFDQVRLAGQVLRYYKGYRVTGWQGELTFSFFIRFQISAKSLFVEASNHLLPPLSEKFYRCDALIPNPPFKVVFGIFVRAFAWALIIDFFWFFVVFYFFLRWLQRQLVLSHERHQAREIYNFNRGALKSIREYATGDVYRRYFQKSDKEYVHKILEKTVLDNLASFLEARGYDTSDLTERQNVILNNGVMISGGNLNAESLTVGQKAQTVVQKMFGGTPQQDQKSPKP